MKGRVYYNLHNWYKLIGLILTSSESIRAWENFLGIRSHRKPASNTAFPKRMRNLFVILKLLLFHSKRNKKFFKFFDEKYKELISFSTTFRQRDTEKIFMFFEESGKVVFEGFAQTIVNDFFTFKSHDYFRKLIASIGINDENFSNDLLCGIEGVESWQPILKLLEMKQYILGHKNLKELFNQLPDVVYQSLQKEDRKEFKLQFDEYINRYGDRTTEDLKLERVNLRMNPVLLVNMLQSQMNNNNITISFINRQLGIRKNAEKTVAAKLKYNPVKRLWFNLVLNLTRSAVRARENMRFCRTRAYGMVKEMFLEIGERMANHGIIELPEDVFYLQVDDLKKYAIDKNMGSQKEKIYSLKKEFSEFEKMHLPDRIIYSDNLPEFTNTFVQDMQQVKGKMKGTAVSKGIVSGKAFVLEQPSTDRRIDGEILVTRMTDPGWIFLMSQAGGIVTEKGSLLSHTAIVGRELGIPVVVGVNNVTRLIKTGETVTVDGNRGVVEIVEHGSGN